MTASVTIRLHWIILHKTKVNGLPVLSVCLISPLAIHGKVTVLNFDYL